MSSIQLDRPIQQLVRQQRPSLNRRITRLVAMLRSWRLNNRPSMAVETENPVISSADGMQIIQGVQTFETQGVILSVNIVRSALKVVYVEEDDMLGITGLVDSGKMCVVEVRRTECEEGPVASEAFQPGLHQKFKIKVPLSALGTHRRLEVVAREAFAGAAASNGTSRPTNPYNIGEQRTEIELIFVDKTQVPDSPQKSRYLFEAKIIGQHIRIRDKKFALLEIFGKPVASGQGSPGSPASIDSEVLNSNDCTVCLSARKNTIVLPCRHMCLCLCCAQTIRGRSPKCPICRQAFRALLHIDQIDVLGDGERKNSGIGNDQDCFAG